MPARDVECRRTHEQKQGTFSGATLAGSSWAELRRAIDL
jgi:hypothetical protein